MKQLLDKKEHDLLRIFTKIDAVYPQPVTIRELQESLHLSHVTIIKDIQTLNGILTSSNLPVEIVTSSTGVMIEKELSFQSKLVGISIFENSLMYHYLITLLSPVSTSAQTFCRTQNISSSYFYKRIQTLKQFLGDYRLSVDVRGNRLTGAEKDIRYFLFQLFWGTFSNYHWPYSHIQKAECQLLLDHFLQKSGYQANLIEKEKFLHGLAIIRLRLLSQGFIQPEEELFDIRFKEGQPIFAELVDAVRSLYQKKTSFPADLLLDEYRFFYTMINITLFEHEHAGRLEQVLQLYDQYHPVGSELTLLFASQLYTILGVDLRADPRAMLELTKIHNHASWFVGLPLSYDMAAMLQRYQSEYPVVFAAISTIVNTVLQSKPMNRDFLTTHYLLILGNYIDLYAFNPKLHVKIACAEGPLVEKQVELALLQRYQNKISIYPYVDAETDLLITEYQTAAVDLPTVSMIYPLTQALWNKLDTLIFTLHTQKSKAFLAKIELDFPHLLL